MREFWQYTHFTEETDVHKSKDDLTASKWGLKKSFWLLLIYNITLKVIFGPNQLLFDQL